MFDLDSSRAAAIESMMVPVTSPWVAPRLRWMMPTFRWVISTAGSLPARTTLRMSPATPPLLTASVPAGTSMGLWNPLPGGTSRDSSSAMTDAGSGVVAMPWRSSASAPSTLAPPPLPNSTASLPFGLTLRSTVESACSAVAKSASESTRVIPAWRAMAGHSRWLPARAPVWLVAARDPPLVRPPASSTTGLRVSAASSTSRTSRAMLSDSRYRPMTWTSSLPRWDETSSAALTSALLPMLTTEWKSMPLEAPTRRMSTRQAAALRDHGGGARGQRRFGDEGELSGRGVGAQAVRADQADACLADRRDEVCLEFDALLDFAEAAGDDLCEAHAAGAGAQCLGDACRRQRHEGVVDRFGRPRPARQRPEGPR